MSKKVTCDKVVSHLESLWKWDGKYYLTDGYKAGSGETYVKKLAVMWKPKLAYIKKACEDGCNFIICHESIAVKTLNSSKEPETVFALEEEKEKFDFIRKTGLVIYRCHDLWDRMQEIGVRDTWQEQLFRGNPPILVSHPYCVTQIPQVSLKKLAELVLEKVKPYGQNGVLLCGNVDSKVSKIATGTGVCTDTAAMKKLGADAAVITDDYYLHVRQGVLSEEMNFPTITVNHNAAEEKAIENLSKYLQKVFPFLSISYYRQGCPYTVIT